MDTPDDFKDLFRDIVETRADVRHIRETLDQFSECIRDHDTRIRNIEIGGSKAAKETADTVERLEVRVTTLEKETGLTDKEKKTIERVEEKQRHWIDSNWTKAGIAAGILTILMDIWLNMREMF